jgi:TolB-like protein
VNSAEDKDLGIKKWLTGPGRKGTAVVTSVPEKTTQERHRIAVLPFANMSPDPTDSYFADGITEEMISTLSNIHDFAVISRTSVMQYQGARKNLADIGKELKAGMILEGSVRKAGNQVRITVQLVDPVEDKHLWTQSYDRELQDIFAVQSDIARSVATAVKVELLTTVASQIGKKPTTSTEAYLQYLKGKLEWSKRSEEGARKGVEHFSEALKQDPNFALAHIGLADSYFIMEARGAMTPKESTEKAAPAISKALQLDQRLADAHASHARLLEYHFNWDAAEAEYKKAIDLNPSNALAHQWYSYLLAEEGRHENAFAEAEKALELAPLDGVVLSNFGHRLIMMERHQDAIEYYKRSLAIQPNLLSAQIGLIIAYACKGDSEEAFSHWEKYYKVSRPQARTLVFLASIQALVGKNQQALSTFDSASKLDDFSGVPPTLVAWVFAALRDEHKTFEWLEKALARNDSWITGINDNFVFKDLRSRPRYQAILKKMGLDKYQQ